MVIMIETQKKTTKKNAHYKNDTNANNDRNTFNTQNMIMTIMTILTDTHL